MTQDEIESALHELEVPSVDFTNRGTELFNLAIDECSSPTPVHNWLGKQWTAAMMALPRIAMHGAQMQYEHVLHLWGIAQTMALADFPRGRDYVTHASEMRNTFEKITMLASMLDDIAEGKPDEPMH